MNSFRNPYTFVRTPARDTDADNPLGDARPGRHAGQADQQLLRGVVPYTITAISPLLLTAGDSGEAVRVPVDPEGVPVLAPTAVKGMIRSAYEAVTNSRYGVLDEKASPLTFRRPARNAEQQPARVFRQDGELHAMIVRSLLHAEAPLSDTQAAPWVPFYGRDREPLPGMASRRHGEEVEAWLYFMKHSGGRQPFHLWRASDVSAPGDLPPTPGTAPTSQHLAAVPGCAPVKVRGFLLVTGRSFARKHDERLVVSEVLSGPAQIEHQTLRVDERVARAWKAVVKSYRDIDARPAGTKPAAYVTDGSFLELDGRCCFARVSGGELLGLFPSMIGREAFPESVRERLHPTLHPARTIDELSPADRVFGWVAEASGPDRSVDAYRGHLWLGPVRCDSGADAVQTFTSPWPLAALNGPKPSQTRFYVGDEAGNPRSKGPTSGKEGYAPGRRPRGRKAYWPRLDLPDDYWQGSRAGEASELPPPARLAGSVVREHVAGSATSANVTRDVASWVAPETTFSGEIRFDGLTRVEAGALLWLLTRPDHLMIGGGRPLGFGQITLRPSGTVTLEVAPGGAEVGGERLDVDSVIDSFLETSRDSVSLRDFSTVSTGTSSHVHYPRSAYDRDAPSYEWFVFNEHDKNRHTLPLPDGGDLPYLEDPRPTRQPTPGQRGRGGPGDHRASGTAHGSSSGPGGRGAGERGSRGGPGSPPTGGPSPGPPRDRPRPG